jgi:hypothetical protein
MPYSIRHEGNKYEVVVTATGRVVGTHPNKAQAQAQLGALYTNVPDVKKAQGPCWDGYEYAGTKEQDGKTVPNCIPVKKESAGAGRISGGVGFKLEYNVPDCQGGYAVTKAGTGQVIGCYTTKEHAEEAMKTIAVNEPVVKNDQGNEEGIGSFNFWNGSFVPVIGSEMQDMRYNSTYNTPPQKDGQPSAGYGNRSDKNGRSNS